MYEGELDMASLQLQAQPSDVPPGSRLDIRELLALGARTAGAKAILSDRNRTVTGNDLLSGVNGIATLLASLKSTNQPGQSIVAIDAEGTIDSIECYWATLHAGLTPLLIPSGLELSRLWPSIHCEPILCAISVRRKQEFKSLGMRSYDSRDLRDARSMAVAAAIPPQRFHHDHDLCSIVVGTGADGQTKLFARSHRSVALTGLVGQLMIGPGEDRVGISGPVSSTLFEWILHCAIMARIHIALLDQGESAAAPPECDLLVSLMTAEEQSATQPAPSAMKQVRRVALLDPATARSFRSEAAYEVAILAQDGHGFVGSCRSSDERHWWLLAPLVRAEIPGAGMNHPEEILAQRPFSAQSGVEIENLQTANLDLGGRNAFPADVGTVFRASAVQRPDDPALIQSEVTLTYGELSRRAACVASVLRNEFGVGRGDRVALLALNRIEFFEIYLAAVQLGAVFVPLNFRLSESEIRQIVGDCKPKLVIAESELLRRLGNQLDFLPEGGRILAMSDLPVDPGSEYERRIARVEPLLETIESEDHEISSILYTAGTTGLPKGVARSHKAVLWFGFIFCPTSLRQIPAAAHLCTPPLFHIAGHETAALPALAMGRRVVVQRQFDAPKMLATIDRHGITSAFLPPSMAIEIGVLLDSCSEDISSLRDVSSGSAPISIEARDVLCRHLPALRFKNSLGMTEVGGIASLQGERLFTKSSTCVGSAGPGVDIRIADPGDQPLAPGQTGEIQIRSPQLFSEYWSRPDATLSAFEGGWFHTGDLGLIDEDGDLHIVGRIKDMIVTGGENVYAAEVERVLLSIEGVSDAAVIGVPDPKWGESVLAWIIRSPGAAITEAEVIAQCRQKIAHYKCPRHCLFIEAFPRSAVGKVLKQALRERWDRIELAST